jgi:hypothetical protein
MLTCVTDCRNASPYFLLAGLTNYFGEMAMLSETCLRSANVKAASEGAVCLSLDRGKYREVLEDSSKKLAVRKESVIHVLHQKQRKREITNAKHEDTKLIKNRRKSNTSLISAEILAQLEAEGNVPSGEDSHLHGGGDSKYHGDSKQRKASAQISDFLSVDLSLNSKVRRLLFRFQPTSCQVPSSFRDLSAARCVFTF